MREILKMQDLQESLVLERREGEVERGEGNKKNDLKTQLRFLSRVKDSASY